MLFILFYYIGSFHYLKIIYDLCLKSLPEVSKKLIIISALLKSKDYFLFYILTLDCSYFVIKDFFNICPFFSFSKSPNIRIIL